MGLPPTEAIGKDSVRHTITRRHLPSSDSEAIHAHVAHIHSLSSEKRPVLHVLEPSDALFLAYIHNQYHQWVRHTRRFVGRTETRLFPGSVVPLDRSYVNLQNSGKVTEEETVLGFTIL